MEDPYEVLGVERGASPDEVKSAYREMLKEYHPDRCDREDAEDAYAEYVGEAEERGDPDRSPFGDSPKTEGATETGSREKGQRRGVQREAWRTTDRRRYTRPETDTPEEPESRKFADAVDSAVRSLYDALPSFTETVRHPSKLTLWVFALPVILLAKLFVLVGLRRLTGALAVVAVGPVSLLLLNSAGAVYNPFLRDMSLTDAFVTISVPALLIAAVVQFIYETAMIKYE